MSETALEPEHEEVDVASIPGDDATTTASRYATSDSGTGADAPSATATATGAAVCADAYADLGPADVTAETSGKHERSPVSTRTKVLTYDRNFLFSLRFTEPSLARPKELREDDDALAQILYLRRADKTADCDNPSGSATVMRSNFTHGYWQKQPKERKMQSPKVEASTVIPSVSGGSSLPTEALANRQSQPLNSDSDPLRTAAEEPVRLLDLKVLQRQENAHVLVRYLMLTALRQCASDQKQIERLLCELMRAGLVTHQSYRKGLLEATGFAAELAEIQPDTWARFAELMAATGPPQLRQQLGQPDRSLPDSSVGTPPDSNFLGHSDQPTNETGVVCSSASAELCNDSNATTVLNGGCREESGASFLTFPVDDQTLGKLEQDMLLRQEPANALLSESPEHPDPSRQGVTGSTLHRAAATAAEQGSSPSEHATPGLDATLTVTDAVQSTDKSYRSERANVAARLMKQFCPRLLDAQLTKP